MIERWLKHSPTTVVTTVLTTEVTAGLYLVVTEEMTVGDEVV